MNRREVITGMAIGGIIGPLTAQSGTITLGSLITEAKPEMSLEERKRQFEICKIRGHSPFFDLTSNFAVNAVYRTPESNPFQMCKYCRTSYRFVTTMEETNKPEHA